MKKPADLPFVPADNPPGSHGIPSCAYKVRAAVLLRRQDTLGRPLAFTDAGEIVDDDDNTHTAQLLDDPEQGVAAHQALFGDVITGSAEWRWPGDPPDEHLIGFDTVSEQQRFAPGDALGEPVLLDVIHRQRRATLIHLPPPVIINLRDDASPRDDLLTETQLDYFRRNGSNALIFVHGYSVTHGEWGRFFRDSRWSRERRPPSHGFGKEPVWHEHIATVRQDAQALEADHKDLALDEDELNGSGAHNWAVNMEYQLNRAAGFDGGDWVPYSRIITISWPGDTGATDFMQAEMNAMTAGRRLAPLLLQLQDAGIAVNLITHSLGARVALTALNIVAILGRQNLVDHLFLWQPAVADNALTDDPGRDVHPLGLGVFPAAHAAARQVVVLHSRGDGILGPQDESGQSPLLRIFRSGPGAILRDILAADDPMDEALGHLKGAYDKKWWTFPSFLDNGFAPALKDLYRDYLPLAFDSERAARAPRARPLQERRRRALRNWERLEQDILAEARALRQPCIDCLRNGERPPDYKLLAPLNHHASVSIDLARDYIKRLRTLALNNWRPEHPPRPALGYVGLDEVAGDEDTGNRDQFLRRLRLSDQLMAVDQSKWLFSHSGMRIPSEDVYERSYKEAIMNRLRDEGVGFGRY